MVRSEVIEKAKNNGCIAFSFDGEEGIVISYEENADKYYIADCYWCDECDDWTMRPPFKWVGEEELENAIDDVWFVDVEESIANSIYYDDVKEAFKELNIELDEKDYQKWYDEVDAVWKKDLFDLDKFGEVFEI